MSKKTIGLTKFALDEIRFVGNERLGRFSELARRVSVAHAELAGARREYDAARLAFDGVAGSLDGLAAEYKTAGDNAARRAAAVDEVFGAAVADAVAVARIGELQGDARARIVEMVSGKRPIAERTGFYCFGEQTLILTAEQRQKIVVPHFDVAVCSDSVLGCDAVKVAARLAAADAGLAKAQAEFSEAVADFVACARDLGEAQAAEAEGVRVAIERQAAADAAAKKAADEAVKEAEAVLRMYK